MVGYSIGICFVAGTARLTPVWRHSLPVREGASPLLLRSAAPSTGTRFEIQSPLSLSTFVDELNKLPVIYEHRRENPSRTRYRSLEVSVDGSEVDIQMLSVWPAGWVHSRRGTEGRILVRLIGRAAEVGGGVVFSGRLIARRDSEVRWQDRVAPWAIVIGSLAMVVLFPLSEVVGAAAGGVAVGGATFYLLALGTIREMRPTRIVEAAGLLGTVGEVTQGLVSLEPRRAKLLLRVFEPVLMDVPGPLVSQAIDQRTAGHAASVTRPHGRARSFRGPTVFVDETEATFPLPANVIRGPVSVADLDASLAIPSPLTALLAVVRGLVPFLIIVSLTIARLGPQPDWWAAGLAGLQPRLFLGMAVLGVAGPVRSLVGNPSRARKLIPLMVWVAELAIAAAFYDETFYKAISGAPIVFDLLIALYVCWTAIVGSLAAVWALRLFVRR